MNVIVDVQGFKTDANEFIVKEIAVLSQNQLQVFLIKSPYPFYYLTKTEKKQARWIERNKHIFWDEGFIPYYCWKDYIYNYLKDKDIYVKGIEKVRWIKEMFSRDIIIFNLEDKGCPSITKLYAEYKESRDIFSCIYHNNICAQKNVICLSKWCLKIKFFKI